MKATELIIAELQKIVDEHGDLPLYRFVPSVDWGGHYKELCYPSLKENAKNGPGGSIKLGNIILLS